MSHPDTPGGLTIHAKCFGKESSNPDINDTRMILPQGALHNIIDAYVAEQLHQAISSELCPLPGTSIAGIPRTQVADIVAPAHKIIADAIDQGKYWTIAQQDVRQHYDTFDLPQIIKYLHSCQVHPPLLALALKLMTQPKICLSLPGPAISLSGRVRGGLTGTCVAGAL
jgi:hypothetical protein